MNKLSDDYLKGWVDGKKEQTSKFILKDIPKAIRNAKSQTLQQVREIIEKSEYIHPKVRGKVIEEINKPKEKGGK